MDRRQEDTARVPRLRFLSGLTAQSAVLTSSGSVFEQL